MVEMIKKRRYDPARYDLASSSSYIALYVNAHMFLEIRNTNHSAFVQAWLLKGIILSLALNRQALNCDGRA
jgi:hypothetical protein